jgi:hypothetical protein
MAMDEELQKKLQLFLVAAIVLAGWRAAYVVWERREARKEDAKVRVETPLKADYYVTPKKLHAYDLQAARELMEQPVWVKYGYELTYFPYDQKRHKTDFGHEAGTLAPMQKLMVQDVVMEVAPNAPGVKQVEARFALDGRNYAVPIGAARAGDFKLRADDIFFLEDPHVLYKHWPAAVWQNIDEHEVQAGMSELQVSFAIGVGVPEGSGDYGSRTLDYANAGKPLVISFEDDKAIAIKPGT